MRFSLKSAQFLFLLICQWLFITMSKCQGENSVYKLISTIDTGMEITKSLSISSISSQLIIGSKNGQLKIFELNTGNMNLVLNQQNTAIFSTVWIYDRNGLVTVSLNKQTNKTIAIIRDRYTYQETFRWQFNESVISVDGSDTEFESYVSFNFGNRIDEYDLRLRQMVHSYNGFGKTFYQHSYSPNHMYLYALSYDQKNNYHYMHHIPCRQNFILSYYSTAILSHLEVHKLPNDKYQLIIKETTSNAHSFWVEDFDLTKENQIFPTDFNYSYFKYCSQHYILGVTQDQFIVFYSKDYLFKKLAQIYFFKQNSINILQIQCKNGYIAISAENNFVYLYQLSPFTEGKPETNWVYIGLGIGLGCTVLLVFSLIVYKKVQKTKLSRKIKLQKKLINSSDQLQ